MYFKVSDLIKICFKCLDYYTSQAGTQYGQSLFKGMCL